MVGGLPLKSQEGPIKPSVEFPPSRGLLIFANDSCASITTIWGLTQTNFSWASVETPELSKSAMTHTCSDLCSREQIQLILACMTLTM